MILNEEVNDIEYKNPNFHYVAMNELNVQNREELIQENEIVKRFVTYSIDNLAIFGRDAGDTVNQNNKKFRVLESEISQDIEVQFYFSDRFSTWFLSLPFSVYIRRFMFCLLLILLIVNFQNSLALTTCFLFVLLLYLKISLSWLETGFLIYKNVATFDFWFLFSLIIMIYVTLILQNWDTSSIEKLFAVFVYQSFSFLWGLGILLSDSFIHCSRRIRILNNFLFILNCIRTAFTGYYRLYYNEVPHNTFCIGNEQYFHACFTLQRVQVSSIL